MAEEDEIHGAWESDRDLEQSEVGSRRGAVGEVQLELVRGGVAAGGQGDRLTEGVKFTNKALCVTLRGRMLDYRVLGRELITKRIKSCTIGS